MTVFELTERLSAILEEKGIEHRAYCVQKRIIFNIAGSGKQGGELRDELRNGVTRWAEGWVDGKVAIEVIRQVSRELDSEVAITPLYLRLMGAFGDYRFVVELGHIQALERRYLLLLKARKILMAALASGQGYLSERVIRFMCFGEVGEEMSINHQRQIRALLEKEGILYKDRCYTWRGLAINRKKASEWLRRISKGLY